MQGKGLFILLALTALGAYTVGRSSSPASYAPIAAIVELQPPAAKPVAPAPPVLVSTGAPPTSSPPSSPPPTIKSKPDKIATAPALEKPTPSDAKHKVEIALTAAAIAAVIIKASRDRYYARGRPCACPDDTMRNGRACGSRSAYSRPGGAAPLCYVHDVTPAMIDAFRKTASAQR
jgi:hypothetical protein